MERLQHPHAMKVGLFLAVRPTGGGMFQYARSLLEALAGMRGEIETLVAYVDPLWEPILADFPVEAMHLKSGDLGLKMADALMALRVPAGLSRSLSAAFNPVARQLGRAEADLWIFPAQDSMGYQTRKPSVVTVHDLMHRYEGHFPEVAGGGRRKIRDHRFASLIENAVAVLVDSETGKRHAIESYESDPARIWPLPYVPPRYILDENEPEDFAERFPLPEKFFFYPAQFWDHKNHRRLFRAVERLRDLSVRLVCTGGHGHNFEQIRDFAAEIGVADRISFPGYVPDAYLRGFYRRARALVMPTFFGPTNIPPLEAFACGCPVAISGTYGMPEQAGDAALFIEPSSVDSIEAAMRSLWCDDALCAELAERGKRQSARWRQDDFNRRFREILRALPR